MEQLDQEKRKTVEATKERGELKKENDSLRRDLGRASEALLKLGAERNAASSLSDSAQRTPQINSSAAGNQV